MDVPSKPDYEKILDRLVKQVKAEITEGAPMQWTRYRHWWAESDLTPDDSATLLEIDRLTQGGIPVMLSSQVMYVLIREAVQGVEDDPEDADSHLRLAQYFRDVGEDEAAIYEYRMYQHLRQK